jgi:hypothetical protein
MIASLLKRDSFMLLAAALVVGALFAGTVWVSGGDSRIMSDRYIASAPVQRSADEGATRGAGRSDEQPSVALADATGLDSGVVSYYNQNLANPGCAHRTAPLGSTVTVENLRNGKSITCEVVDRGPYVAGRVLDLDETLFAQLDDPGVGSFPGRISW